MCPRCKDVETVTHLLFNCPFAIKVWNEAPLALQFQPELITSAIEGISKTSRHPTLPPTWLGPGSLPAWIVWNLWIARNQLIFQKREISPEQTLHKAITEAREWTLSQEHQINNRSAPSIATPESAPPPGLLCVYTDAAWNASSECAGLGWVFVEADSNSSLSATS